MSSVELTSHYPAGSNISLQCTWNTSVYYVAWYKNGTLIYEEDLAAPSILMAPKQGFNVVSDFAMMTSNLTVNNVELVDSGNYTCAVTCVARGVEFGTIAGNLQGTAVVFVYGECLFYIHEVANRDVYHVLNHTLTLEHPNAPNGLSVIIKPDDTTPVTANIPWMALMGRDAGISPGGNQDLRYFVVVTDITSAVLLRATVEYPVTTVDAPNLPACDNLTVSVTAENLFFNGTSVSEYFMTVEPGWYLFVITKNTSKFSAGIEVAFSCVIGMF